MPVVWLILFSADHLVRSDISCVEGWALKPVIYCAEIYSYIDMGIKRHTSDCVN